MIKKCVCGEQPKLLLYKTICVVKCDNCGRFSTGDSSREAIQEWEERMRHEKQSK